MDISRIETTISKYQKDITNYHAEIKKYQSHILDNQDRVNKLSAEIVEHEEAMKEYIDFIKATQAKIFGAQEAIVALNEITE